MQKPNRVGSRTVRFRSHDFHRACRGNRTGPKIIRHGVIRQIGNPQSLPKRNQQSNTIGFTEAQAKDGVLEA
jgi:hypothetical protein